MAAARFGLDSFAWGGERLDVFQLEVPQYLMGQTLTLRAEADGQFTLLDDEERALLTGGTGEQIERNGIRIQVAELIAGRVPNLR